MPFKEVWQGVRFVAVNMWCTRNVPVSQEPITVAGRLLVRPLSPEELDTFQELHARLRRGKPLSKWRRWLYRSRGPRLVWVVQAPDGELAGFNMYYFREGEWRRQVVHEAFVGVSEQFRAQGLANAMRAVAADRFAKAGLSAISTQIDSANVPSLRSAQRQGFRETASSPDGKLQLLRSLRGVPSERPEL